jgi:hypothetical protein
MERILNKLTSVTHRMLGKRRVHFLHLGKTGGSAVKDALRDFPERGRYEIILHNHHTKMGDIPGGEGVVFFLREPVSRFVSGFYSRQRQGQPRIFIPWSDEEKLAFERFAAPNDLAVALGSSDVGERNRAQDAMRSIGHVKTSYWDWFQNEAYLRSRLGDLFFIGFQERLDEDFEIVKSKLGLPEDLKLPHDEVRAHRNPTGLDKKLSDEAISNLNEWYKRDFEFIALCKAIIRDRPSLRESPPSTG